MDNFEDCEDDDEEHNYGNGDERKKCYIEIEDPIHIHLGDCDDNLKEKERQTRNGAKAFDTLYTQKRAHYRVIFLSCSEMEMSKSIS